MLVLTARRTGLAAFEAAFKEAGIPYLSSRRGGLLDTLEVADLLALLGWLVAPGHDLLLVHALKSPIFGLHDADLLAMRDQGNQSWFTRLQAYGDTDEAPASVRRANALLLTWQAVAGRLPPHDLLDQIFHQGELVLRYGAAAPPHLRPSVLANLHGLLELSLKIGSGRFPSLSRFLDELEALRLRAGDEAPDEAPAATGEAVRMLTIHAAKGLEAPIVFLIKADEDRRSNDHHGVLLDWPVDADRPAHFSLFGKREWRGSARQALFDAEHEQAEREALNLLYVAMTRAKQALFVSGLEGGKANTWLSRLDTALQQATLEELPAMRFTDSPVASQPARQESAGNLAGLAVTQVGSVGRRRTASTPAVNFGIRVHRYLELAAAEHPMQAIRAELGVSETEFSTIREMAERLRQGASTRRFFEPGRGRAELDFVDENGELRRIDRVVEFDDEVWVLDFKTGQLDEADPARRALPHHQQLAEYRQAVGALYPGKTVRAALLFGDGLAVEVCETGDVSALRPTA